MIFKKDTKIKDKDIDSSDVNIQDIDNKSPTGFLPIQYS
jgi:hypothetical protein